MEKTIRIKNQTGLHARPVTKFVQLCQSYMSTIYLRKNDVTVVGNSIIKVMSLGIVYGDEITLSADGADAAEAVHSLAEFLSTYEE